MDIYWNTLQSSPNTKTGNKHFKTKMESVMQGKKEKLLSLIIIYKYVKTIGEKIGNQTK